jgi:hypothetical protein
VARVLDHLRIPQRLVTPWGEGAAGEGPAE